MSEPATSYNQPAGDEDGFVRIHPDYFNRLLELEREAMGRPEAERIAYMAGWKARYRAMDRLDDVPRICSEAFSEWQERRASTEPEEARDE